MAKASGGDADGDDTRLSNGQRLVAYGVGFRASKRRHVGFSDFQGGSFLCFEVRILNFGDLGFNC